jgi:hypothetical protein
MKSKHPKFPDNNRIAATPLLIIGYHGIYFPKSFVIGSWLNFNSGGKSENQAGNI